MVVRGLEQTEKQSKHWIYNDHWTKWNGVKCVDPMLELLIASGNKISENGRNIYEWNQSNKQDSKLISIEHSGMDDDNQKGIGQFEDLEYLNIINIQYSEVLSNVTERGFKKLNPSELSMDVRFGRSTFIHFKSFHYYFALSTNMNHHIFHQVPIHRV